MLNYERLTSVYCNYQYMNICLRYELKWISKKQNLIHQRNEDSKTDFKLINICQKAN